MFEVESASYCYPPMNELATDWPVVGSMFYLPMKGFGVHSKHCQTRSGVEPQKDVRRAAGVVRLKVLKYFHFESSGGFAVLVRAAALTARVFEARRWFAFWATWPMFRSMLKNLDYCLVLQ